MPAYRGSRNTGPGPAVSGKRIPGWLPFSKRLLLLPKGVAFDGDGELREHRDVNGGWLRPAVFGAMDGLVTNSSLIAGIGGGGGGHGMIVLTGIAGLIAGAFSMATGEYISVKSQNELTAAEVELERRQHARDPEGKRTRLTELYMDKGVSPNLAEAVVRQISADMDRAVATHVREELGIDPDDLPSPQTAAVGIFHLVHRGRAHPAQPVPPRLPDGNGLRNRASGERARRLAERQHLVRRRQRDLDSLPSPRTLRTPATPPCASATARTSASPSPAPGNRGNRRNRRNRRNRPRCGTARRHKGACRRRYRSRCR